ALNPDGSFTYAPAADFSGTDSFTFAASDGQAFSAPAMVTLTVTPVQDAPAAPAAPVRYAVLANGTLTIPVSALLANVTDPDGDALSLIGYTQPDGQPGTVSVLADTELTYVPPPNFTGTATFSYT